jgi:enterochelin esterase-like enzyme
VVDLYEFEASLVYRASSKTARVTQRKTVSKKQKTPLPSKRKKKRKKKKKKEKKDIDNVLNKKCSSPKKPKLLYNF